MAATPYPMTEIAHRQRADHEVREPELRRAAEHADPAAAPARLVATVTDPLGHVTAYDYNSRGSVTHVTYALGRADEACVQFAYDSANRLISQTDELGRRTQFTYDALSRVIARTDPDPDGAGPLAAPVTRFEYTPLGQLLRETDPLGRVTEYVYQNGQLAEIHGPLAPAAQTAASSVTTTQDALGRVTSETDAMGNMTSYTYEDYGRRVVITAPDPDGIGPLVSPVVIYQHDSAGNVVSITDATGGVTTFGYDDLGRKTTEIGADPDDAGPQLAPVTHYAYDKANNLLSVTDSLGHTTEYAYDARNRRIAILDAEGGLTEFAYDDVGNLLALTDPVGNTTTWVYDGLNRVISETNELGYIRYFSYDLAGRQIEKIDRNGRVTQYGYDLADHLTSEIWYSNAADAAGHQNATNEIHWQYDSAGRLLSESDNYSSSTYTYDSLSRRLTETISNLNSEIVVLTAGYSRADDLRTSLSVTVGGFADLQQTFEYTSTGLLTHIGQTGQTGGNPVSTIGIDLAYDSLGRLVHLDRFQGTSFVAGSTWQYDSQNRLVALTHAQGQNVLAGYTWTYDTAGRLTDATSPDGPVHYSYDDTDQLTGADYEESGLPDEEYQWDANGNRSNTGWATGPNNQLLSDGMFWYSYDPEGNRTARFIWTDSDNDGLVDVGERSQITEYSWDNRNRLTRVAERAVENAPLTKAIDYLYDTQNRWIGRIADLDGTGPETADVLHFIYDDKQILLQQDGSGSITRRYLWNPAAVDQLLAQEEVANPIEPGDVQWALTDHLGSVCDVAQFDLNTTTIEIVIHRTFDSFGRVVENTGTSLGYSAIFIGFTSRFFDLDSGLQNNLTRWYDPLVACWTSQDASRVFGSDCNLARYVFNSPPQFSDPAGLVFTPSEDDMQIASAVYDAAEDLRASGWRPVNPNNPGEFGMALHARVTTRLQGKAGWYADVFIEKGTNRVVSIGSKEGVNVARCVQVDALKVKDGTTIVVGHVVDPSEISGLYDIKATNGFGMDLNQRANLRGVRTNWGKVVDGNVHVVRSPWKYSSGRWVHIGEEASVGLRALQGAEKAGKLGKAAKIGGAALPVMLLMLYPDDAMADLRKMEDEFHKLRDAPEGAPRNNMTQIWLHTEVRTFLAHFMDDTAAAIVVRKLESDFLESAGH